jgi:hypothetical protein
MFTRYALAESLSAVKSPTAGISLQTGFPVQSAGACIHPGSFLAGGAPSGVLYTQ